MINKETNIKKNQNNTHLWVSFAKATGIKEHNYSGYKNDKQKLIDILMHYNKTN